MNSLKKNEIKKLIEFIAPLLLILVSVGVAITFVIVSSQRQLTNLENTLFQAFILGAGLIGTFIFGKLSARKAALELIKPHARSAFRRLLSLYKSLSRLAMEIELSKKKKVNQNSVSKATLDKLGAIVIEQIATADDALEDWRDITPEDVEEIISRLKTTNEEVYNDKAN